MICDCSFYQEKQPFERIEVSRDQALEMFSDNKFKASTAALFTTSHVFFSVLRNHMIQNRISYFLHMMINDAGITLAIMIRLKSSMIYLQTKLSQYIDVVPWSICVVDLIYLTHPL